MSKEWKRYKDGECLGVAYLPDETLPAPGPGESWVCGEAVIEGPPIVNMRTSLIQMAMDLILLVVAGGKKRQLLDALDDMRDFVDDEL